MSALLLLLHRRPVGLDLSAGADLVSVPSPVLLQRSRLAGSPTHRRRDDFSAGIRALDRLTQPRPINGRNVRGLNFFSRVEQTLLAALQLPAFNIAGLRRADLLPRLSQCSPATLTRQLARLRRLHVIKRVAGTYRYYLTRTGRAAIAAGRRLTEHTIIPALA